MERDGDLLLNVSCSHSELGSRTNARKLPPRMPDGSRIDMSRTLTKKIYKTHHAATSTGTVFVPNHKLPVMDEFGLITPKDHVGYEKPMRMLPSLSDREKTHATHEEDRPIKSILKTNTTGDKSGGEPEKEVSSKTLKRRKRKKRQEEPKIISKEVQAVGGGLPASFPQYRLKKFTEEYQEKKRKQMEDGELDEDPKKKRRSFVPGLNPRKREKATSLFTELSLHDLDDLHPYLKQNLEQNFEIKKLTKIQSLTMPILLQTRFDAKRRDIVVNSGIGTGKILSYAVPIVNNLALMEPRIDRTAGIYALVLLPTRELASKVSEIFSKLCQSFLWVVPGLLTGGERKKSEKARLRKGLNILITTPGRLIDHMDHSEKLDFSKMRYCIMADAHRLIDPERAEVSKNIAIMLRKRLPYSSVRCVVTATLTKKLEKFIEILVDKPNIIDAFKDFE